MALYLQPYVHTHTYTHARTHTHHTTHTYINEEREKIIKVMKMVSTMM